jgi:hypothetical protein
MSETHVLTCFTSGERTLVIALLEKRLKKLRTTLGRTEHTRETASLQYLVETTGTLLDKLHCASVLDQSVTMLPERKSST